MAYSEARLSGVRVPIIARDFLESKSRLPEEVVDQRGLPVTRGDYLLDLCLSSQGDVRVKLGPKIADHSSLLIVVPDSMEERCLESRKIW